MLKLTVDARSEPEELNKKAVTIINRVRDKLTGVSCLSVAYFKRQNNSSNAQIPLV